MKEHYHLGLKEGGLSKDCEAILIEGINEEALHVKEMKPIRPFCIRVEDKEQKILGGISGVVLYGCLHVDTLWVKDSLRNQGWGSKLMLEAEKIGKKWNCTFATVNTMDWEALSFYEKLGYAIEFTREGYEKESKMYLLRKSL